MARTSRRQAAIQKKLIYLMAGILALVIFLLVFGLNSLINIGSWIGNTFSGNKAQATVKQNEFFGTLFVDDLPPATNSAELIISGNATDFDRIDFKLNGKRTNSTDVKKDGTFSEKLSSLKLGKNKIIAISKSTKTNNVKESDEYTVIYKNTKPKLDISEPHDGDTIKSQTPEVTIKGSTDPGNTVEVGGAPVTVGVSGSFQTSVRLKDGDNTITITAEDDATNQQKMDLKLKYEKDE
jgi:Sec-independent protein translocase protein TatA